MFVFVTKPGKDNYADCAGTYTLDWSQGTINGKPIYINEGRTRFLASCGDGWVITGIDWLPSVKEKEGAFGGFHSGGGEEPDMGEWDTYEVQRAGQQKAAGRVEASVSPAQMFVFVTKPGKDNYAVCAGMYTLDRSQGTINGKPIYINESRTRFLASCGGGWVITGINCLPSVKEKEGAFGGFHSGGGAEPDVGEWEMYEVQRIIQLTFTAKPGKAEGADASAGTYTLDACQGRINGKAVYVNRQRNTFLYAYEDFWAITSLEHLSEVQATQECIGCIHVGGGAEAEDGEWENYFVTCAGREDPLRRIAADDAAWAKFESTTVAFQAVANSGVCRSEADFFKNRLRCLQIDCGGFAWRKPHFNQFGEEDDPPVCFFFRRLQGQLQGAMKDDDRYDFYLAPDTFCPACGWKPGRDPAPAVHCWWEIESPVHAFACQIRVAEPSPCTYYATCGFTGGYCGIQQHDGTKQQVLFSLWDHPKAGGRVQNRSLCDGVVANPFGGEGQGMGAYCVSGSGAPEDCELAAWEPGATYTFAVQSAAVGGGSEITCSFHKPNRDWVEFARHFRPEPEGEAGGRLSGLYSFIEDFAGNSVRRSGLYAAWVKESPGGPWRPIKRIRGTSTAELDVPNKSLIGVACEDGYQRVEMTTGGDALPSCGLFAGELALPPAPALLRELQAAA